MVGYQSTVLDLGEQSLEANDIAFEVTGGHPEWCLTAQSKRRKGQSRRKSGSRFAEDEGEKGDNYETRELI